MMQSFQMKVSVCPNPFNIRALALLNLNMMSKDKKSLRNHQTFEILLALFINIVTHYPDETYFN